MANSMTDKSIIHVKFALSNDVTHAVSPRSTSLTAALRRAQIDHLNEAGALSGTWTMRDGPVRQAAQFCRALPVDYVASANGDYHGHVYELSGEMSDVVI